MDWKNNPQAELIIDLAGRMTEGNPDLRNKWVPELQKMLSGYPDLDEDAIRAALQAGDALTTDGKVLGPSKQRRSFRERFPTTT